MSPVSSNAATTPSDNELLYADWYADPILMFRQALPHWFPEPMPWVHRGIVAIMLRQTDFLLKFGTEIWEGREYEWTEEELEKLIRNFTTPLDPNQPEGPQREIFSLRYDAAGQICAIDLTVRQHVALVMPRGFSKTTVINACNLYEVVYRLVPFLVYIARSERHSADQLTTVLRELRGNELLLSVFGNLVPGKQDTQKSTSIDVELLNGIYMTVRGQGAQIRGMNKGAVRPHHIVLDDVETRETADSEEQTEKLDRWLYSDVMFALPRRAGVGRITFIGTILGTKTVLVRALTNKRFTAIRFGALLRDGTALWDFAMSAERVEAEREHAEEQAKTYEFNLELLSKVETQRDKKFQGPYIIQPHTWEDFVARAVCIDPASSKEKTSDPTALAVMGMTPRGRLHVCDFVCEVGMDPRRQIDEYFRLHFLWRCTHHGVEAIAYQKALKFFIQEEQARFSQHFGASAFFTIDEIFHGKQGKIPRVELALATRYKAGYITHQRPFPTLEAQLNAWPDGKKDGPDVLAMCANLLAPLSGFAIDDQSALLSDQSMPPLDDDYFTGAP